MDEIAVFMIGTALSFPLMFFLLTRVFPRLIPSSLRSRATPVKTSARAEFLQLIRLDTIERVRLLIEFADTDGRGASGIAQDPAAHVTALDVVDRILEARRLVKALFPKATAAAFDTYAERLNREAHLGGAHRVRILNAAIDLLKAAQDAPYAASDARKPHLPLAPSNVRAGPPQFAAVAPTAA